MIKQKTFKELTEIKLQAQNKLCTVIIQRAVAEHTDDLISSALFGQGTHIKVQTLFHKAWPERGIDIVQCSSNLRWVKSLAMYCTYTSPWNENTVGFHSFFALMLVAPITPKY